MSFHRDRLRLPAQVFIVAPFAIRISPVAADETPAVLIKIVQPDRNQPFVFGELISESERGITLRLLTTGEEKSFDKAKVTEVKRSIEDREAAASIGIPALAGHKICKIVKPTMHRGAVAKVTGDRLYITLGSDHQIKVDDDVVLVREEAAIRDPSTGKSLGSERKKLCTAKVVAVEQQFSVVKLEGPPTDEPRIGDLVDPVLGSRAIAVLPFVNNVGAETAGTRKIGDELIKQLVNRGMTVVERARLADVILELGRQQNPLFDAALAQRLGKQVGAYAVVLGSLQPEKTSNVVQLRMVEVETGRILLAYTGRTSDFMDPSASLPPSPSADAVIAKTNTESPVVFGDAIGPTGYGTEFKDVAPVGTVLVGFRLTTGKFGSGYKYSAAGSIQPLYRGARGDQDGKVHGSQNGNATEFRAKAGYAVGAVKVYIESSRILGIQVTYMRSVNGQLSERDSYESEAYLKVPPNTAAWQSSQHRPAIGIHGWWANDELRSLAFGSSP